MSNFLSGLVIAISFFTIIPMPFIEWTPERTKYMPMFIPAVGIIVGLLGFGLCLLMNQLAMGITLKAVFMTGFYLVITGGVHFDGLMDSADGYFSRRETSRKLEIITDSRVGAFAVMAAILVVLIKFGAFVELFQKDFNPIALVFIPIISRTLQPSMLYLFPQAKNEGLANMYGNTKSKKITGIFFILLLCSCFIVYRLFDFSYLLLPLSAGLFYLFFFFSSKKNFGGITGDLLGAYLELSELVMLVTLTFLL